MFLVILAAANQRKKRGPVPFSEDGSFSQFNERQKEAWLCNDYDYRDSRRVPQRKERSLGDK